MYGPMDTSDEPTRYRILFGNWIKYVTVAADTYGEDVEKFPPNLLHQLPEFPEGAWTEARVYRVPETNSLSFDLSWEKLPGITDIWHNRLIDFLSTTVREHIQAEVKVVTVDHPSLPPNQHYIRKDANFPFEISHVANETSVYKLIEGCGIGPRFIGHLLEHDRVIGFVLEKVDGRFANIDDLDVCTVAVDKLHALGIVHNDLNRYNFIVSDLDDGTRKVTIIDFENAFLDGTPQEMQEEKNSLAEQLIEESGRGGPIVYKYDNAEELVEI
ncbi:hypothetical protein VKT23_005081 [Stygiomarasmius scandens]|uniref:Alpha-galactosidase A n=1 Tax=Marasmiellus scandens TaxID=2682957 RepID=A0ABR1JUN1_9AGAR